MSDSNPISLVYDELAVITYANTILQKYINVNNFIVLQEKGFPKRDISEADLPELVLLISSFEGGNIVSSSRSEFNVTYTWMATTGDFDLGLVAELCWGLLTCSHQWCIELTKLQWCGDSFVKNIVLPGGVTALTDTEQNRGILGWSFSWPIQVVMQLPTNVLRNYQCQDPIQENTE